MLPSGSAMLYYILDDNVFLQSQGEINRKTHAVPMTNMEDTQMFLLPQYVPDREHSDNNNHGNLRGTHN